MKIEYRRSRKGELLVMRDALPKEPLLIPMQERDWSNGTHDAQNCPMFHRIRKYLRLGEEKARDLGLEVGTRIAYVPVPDPDTESGWILLRYRMPQNWVRWFDRGYENRPASVWLLGISRSVTLSEKRRYSAEHLQRKENRSVVNTGQRYTPKRAGFTILGAV